MKADDMEVKGSDLWGTEGRECDGKSAEHWRGRA